MNKYQKLASNTFVLALGQFGSKFLVYVMLRFIRAGSARTDSAMSTTL